MLVKKRDGTFQEFKIEKIHEHSKWACEGLEGVSQSELETDCGVQLYEGMPTSEIHNSLITAAADKVVDHPDWAKVAGRLLLLQMYKEVTGGNIAYPDLKDVLNKGVAEGVIHSDLLGDYFDIDLLSTLCDKVKDNDFNFEYLGLKTLYDRYLKRASDGSLIELPQHFFMRIAMGLSMAEKAEDRTEKAIEFFTLYSDLSFMSSTPTLFNSGTTHPQLSSCFLLSMGDSLDGIFGSLKEAAQYSKFSGGLGMSLTNIRSKGSKVVGTSGIAGGIVPYAKLFNDVLLGFDQGGKRLGAGALYLEPWHYDFEDFLLLKKNVGDERRRAHDTHLASWIPDLFMERLRDGAEWSMFCPNEVPDLHELYGDEFKAAYEDAENRGLAKKVVPASHIWQRIISTLFEFGAGWPCFKDHANNRNMQRDTGVVHSSNLCTEITLNTVSNDTSAVCNLGSINLSRHVTLDGAMDWDKLEVNVKTAIRMLDNVIEIGIIPHENGVKFNQMERAIGLGIMGLTELTTALGIDFESSEYLEFNNELMKRFSYWAIEASADLAQERGSYPLFEDSEWAKGNLPYDTANDNGRALVTGSTYYDLEQETELRVKVSAGMRNSHMLAIAPTATISNIVGTTSCTELPLMQEYSKGNLSGDFLCRSPLLKYGRPDLAKTSREVDQRVVLRAAAVRQIYIDQSQSTNLFLPLGKSISGKELASWYAYAWHLGVKTTYYLRSVSSDELERFEIEAAKQENELKMDGADFLEGVVCSLENPEDCESCQ